MKISGETTLLTLALILPATAAASYPVCKTAGPSVICSCDANQLHPLQGALGREEAEHKRKKIEDKPKKAWRELERDPIAVLRGPSNLLYVTDHHHAAEAWRLANHPDILCRIGAPLTFDTDARFWAALSKAHLVRLKDENGRDIVPSRLPTRLADLPDDPYRSLAWRLRKSNGFCRAKMERKEFAEFIWADWLRARLRRSPGSDASTVEQMLPAALALSRGPTAASLPGYVGTQPAGFECPPDP